MSSLAVTENRASANDERRLRGSVIRRDRNKREGLGNVTTMIQVNGYRIDQDSMYTKDHVWIRITDERNALIGLSDYFLKRYRNIQSCEFPKVGTRLDRNKSMGVIETVKGTAQLYAAVSGEVKEVNAEFLSQMKDVLEDPYGRGWILKVEASNLAAERAELLSADQYASYLRKLAEAGL